MSKVLDAAKIISSRLDESTFKEQSNIPTHKHEFEGHQDNISNFVFLHDNIHIVSGSEDGTMGKWDCTTGLLVGGSWEEKGNGICALALSPDGKTIACGRYGGSVQRWSTDGEMVESIWTGHGDYVSSLSWSPSGDRLASGSKDGIILIRNAESEEIEVGPIETNQLWMHGLAYSPLGDRIASGGKNGTICIWDGNSSELLVGPIDDLGFVSSVLWSLDGSKLYVADRSVRILDSKSGTELHRFEHFDSPYSIALSPKYNLLAAVGHDGATQLWDTESHQPLGYPFHHEDRQKLFCVSFSRDGRFLAYSGYNKKITLWMVKDIVPETEVEATNPSTVDQFDNMYNNFFGSSEPSRPFAVYSSSHPSHRPHILSSQRLQNVLSMFSLSNLRCTRTKVNDDDPLCSICSTLHIYAIFRNGIRQENAIPLGYLTDILKKRDHCGLCRLIATYFSQCGVILPRITCKLYTLTDRSLAFGHKRDTYNGLHIESSRDGFTFKIRLLGEAGSKVWGPKWLHGRRVGQNVDVDQLKRWIHTCKKKHGKTCESDWWRDREFLPNTVRVVDVARMAIVPVPPSCRFVALSYVWGGPGDGYWTTQANLKQRSTPGGLDTSILPGTISDSIILVRQLGERYLWIDSLCIVQDDPGDKAVQIGVMELIYGSSEFTIFAAAGASSRDPLPGVCPGTRNPQQHIAKIQGVHLALPLPDAKNIIAHSTWNERGWTYQEVMLSRRRIFFTAQQVYFECRKEVRSEEILPQPGSIMTGLGQAIPKSAQTHLTCETYLRPYIKIVEEYTQRKLTVESDIVDAIEALLRGLTKAFGLAGGIYENAFRFGMLLTGSLDNALLWQPKADAPHSRRVLANERWPSWSWAAWQGAVKYASDEVFNNSHDRIIPRYHFGHSLVEWYIVDNNGQLVHQYVEHRKRVIFEPDPDLITNIAYVAPKGDIDSQQLMAENVSLLPGTLVFRTSCARFDVTKAHDVQYANGIDNYGIYSILSDIPRPSTRVGRIILPSSTHSPTSHEFIVLLRSNERPLVYDEERLGARYSGCMLYVMAVQKMEDERRVERVGVGIIFEQAWLKSKPEEKIVYLG